MSAAAKEVDLKSLPADMQAPVAAVLKAVDNLKSDMDSDLKKKANADDVVTKEKHDRALVDIDGLRTKLDDFIKDMNAKAAELARTARNNGDDETEVEARLAALRHDERKAFASYIRTAGARSDDDLRAIQAKSLSKDFADVAQHYGVEQKDLSTVIAAEGGYMVLPEYEAEMEEILLETSPVRSLVDVREIGTRELIIPVNRKGTAVAWINEKGTRTETNTPTISQMHFIAEELYAYPEVTLQMLEDGIFDVEGWLHSEVVEALSIEENTSFCTGNGNGKPLGLWHSSITKVAAASYNANTNWGSHAYIATGTAGGFTPSTPGSAVGPTGGTNGADCLYDLVYEIKAAFRQNADWAMARRTMREVRKLKDGDGQYVIRDAITASGLVPVLLGYPVWEFEDAPVIAADSYSIAFGNFQKGYQIVDRIGMQVRRDEITNPGSVKFHFRKRTGGGPKNYDAIKFLKFAAS